jgi:glyoxylase-like metal-dependent hydrolase (beta-lactamase superfamily II)
MELVDRALGRTTVLFGDKHGKYPHGNSLLVHGTNETILIDPSLAVIPRRASLPAVDRVLNSHCHEDHVAGNHLFPDATVHAHDLDAPGLRSFDGFMAIYGFDGPLAETWGRTVVEQFHYVPRPDAQGFADGAVFDLGGGVTVRAIHTPGHTRGHTAFLVEPDGVLYLGDIDLSSFGPYYGDAWSDLEAFERTLALVRGIEARWYATFHHVGVLEGHAAFAERLDRFTGVIARRERELLAYLAEPHTLDEVVAHRFVYRPGDAVSWADPVERRSMGQHLARLLRGGAVRTPEPGLYQAVPGR